MRRAAIVMVCLVAGSCGHGTSGTLPALSRALTVLALQGQSAPGTAGTFGAVGPSIQADIAEGGFCAFVADVVAGPTTPTLFAVSPLGEVLPVFAVGDLLPDSSPGTGTITAFLRVRVAPSGALAALVSGTGPSVGILTARFDPVAGIVERRGTIYSGDELPLTATMVDPGTLTAVSPDLWVFADDGTSVFEATGSLGGLRGIFEIGRDGGGLDVVVASGDSLPGGGTAVAPFLALTTEANGGTVAFATGVAGGPSPEGVYVFRSGFARLVARTGDVPLDGGTRAVADLFTGGPLVLTTNAGEQRLYWTGRLSGASPNLAVLSADVTEGTVPLVSAVVAGGQFGGRFGGPSAVFGDPVLLDSSLGGTRAVALAIFTFPPPSTATLRTILSIGGRDEVVELVGQGQQAPGGSIFTSQFPSLSVPDARPGNSEGSAVFTATLADGSTGVFLAAPGETVSAVREGEFAPGAAGGAFLPFGLAPLVKSSSRFVLFQAAVSGEAASGLFRRG